MTPFDSQEIALLLERLDQSKDSVVTSVRVPTALREVAKVMGEVGLIGSWNEVLVQGARDRLEAIAHRAGLDAHYSDHPELRPQLAEVAAALARLDDSPLAGRLDLIERSAAELTAIRPDVTADDVLTYACGLLSMQSAA